MKKSTRVVIGLVAALSLMLAALPVLAVIATGGVVSDSGIYRTHTFTENGTFTVAGEGAVEVLVVGGGGGGGGAFAGGGGGGGVIVTSMLVTSGEYEVVVGSGGGGGMGYNQPYQAGKQGENSSFGTELVAIGGGGGSGWTGHPSTSGGSGGGGNSSVAASEGMSGQGHSGAVGSSASSNRSGGGGGGAGEPGSDGLAGVGGKGGDGILFYGSYFGGGGGGGLEKRSGVLSSSGGGEGGLGGGGNGSSGSLRAIDGAPNTGGGGGGAGYNGNVNAQLGGDGGSGIVIVRYKQQIINGGGASEITTTTARLNGELVFTNMPNTEIAVFWGATDACGDVDGWDYSEQWQVQEAGAVFTNVTGLLPDTTYYYCYAVITDNAVIWPLHSESFITGEVWLEAVSVASEIGLVPGTVMVHRAASAVAEPLEVNYSISGTATADEDYVALSGKVVIPAGETSAVIEIVPLFDRLIEGTETVVLTLKSGSYAVGTEKQAVVEIEDRGKVFLVWSGAGKDALASNPGNWFEGEVPTPVDGVALDGSSVKAMTWDVEYPVAAWRQTADYTGTVTFNTVYPGQGSFTNFVVTGDVELLGGTWTHPANSGGEVEVERLCVTVGGDFTLGASGAININGKGHEPQMGPGAGNNSGLAAARSASYGGSGAYNIEGRGTYGSAVWPENLGSGARGVGGGALKLIVGGKATINGKVLALGTTPTSNNNYCHGTGGSILIMAHEMGGSGTLDAGLDVSLRSSYYGSGGGRIALHATASADFSELSLSAYAYKSTINGYNGAAGTIYLSGPEGARLIVDQGGFEPLAGNGTDIPAVASDFAVDPAIDGELADAILVVTNKAVVALTRDIRFKNIGWLDSGLTLNSFTLYLKESAPDGVFPADFGGGVVEPSGSVYTFDDGTPVIRDGRLFWGDSNVTWRVVSLATPTVGGTATFDGGETEGYYAPESELTFTAAAAAGFDFIFWDGTLDSGTASEVNPLQLAPISGNRVLRANFLDASLDPNLNVWLDVPFNRDWFDKRNWSLMAVPSAGQRVLLNAGSDVVIAGETALLDEIVVRDSLLTLTAGGGQLRADLVDISGSTLQFEAAAEGEVADSGEITRIDAGELVLELNELKVVDGNHTLDLAGADIEVGSFILQGFGEAVTSKFNVVNGGTIYVTDALTVGSGANCDAHLLLAADVGLELGSPEKRIELVIGMNSGGVYADTSLITGNKFNGWISSFSVGRRVGGYSAGDNRGKFDLSAVTEPGLLDISGDVMIGWNRMGEGRVVVSDAIDVKIGSAEKRGGFLQIGSISNAGRDLESSLVLGCGRFDAYVTNLEVGAGQTDALLDASRVSAGVLDVAGHVRIAYKYNHDRRLLLSEGMRVKFGDRGAPVEFVAAGESSAIAMIEAKSQTFEGYLTSLRLGQGGAVGTTAVLDLSSVTAGTLEIADELFYGADRNSALSLVLGPGFVTKLGSEAKRAILTIGDGQRWLNMKLSARGSFEAWLESMVVGRRSLETAGAEGYTVLDLSGVTNGLLDVAGAVLIGVGPEALGSDGKATVSLTSCSAAAASLTVGAITNNNAYGHLVMTGSTFRVSGSVVLGPGKTDAEGVIQTTVDGLPCGLDLAEEAQLQVNNGRIEIDFDEPLLEHRGHYWGLRWAGDHVSELESLAAEGKLVWDGTRLPRRVKIFSNRQFSFVGMEAPRSTLIMLR